MLLQNLLDLMLLTPRFLVAQSRSDWQQFYLIMQQLMLTLLRPLFPSSVGTAHCIIGLFLSELIACSTATICLR